MLRHLAMEVKQTTAILRIKPMVTAPSRATDNTHSSSHMPSHQRTRRLILGRLKLPPLTAKKLPPDIRPTQRPSKVLSSPMTHGRNPLEEDILLLSTLLLPLGARTLGMAHPTTTTTTMGTTTMTMILTSQSLRSPPFSYLSTRLRSLSSKSQTFFHSSIK